MKYALYLDETANLSKESLEEMNERLSIEKELKDEGLPYKAIIPKHLYKAVIEEDENMYTFHRRGVRLDVLEFSSFCNYRLVEDKKVKWIKALSVTNLFSLLLFITSVAWVFSGWVSFVIALLPYVAYFGAKKYFFNGNLKKLLFPKRSNKDDVSELTSAEIRIRPPMRKISSWREMLYNQKNLLDIGWMNQLNPEFKTIITVHKDMFACRFLDRQQKVTERKWKKYRVTYRYSNCPIFSVEKGAFLVIVDNYGHIDEQKIVERFENYTLSLKVKLNPSSN